MKKSLFTILLTCIGLSGFAQHELVAPFMNNIPQSAYSNPVLIPEYKVIIGLPVMSSVYMSVRNTGFSYSDVMVAPGSSDTTLAKLTRKMGKKGYAYGGASVDLFFLKIKTGKKSFFSFNVTEQINFRVGYSKDFLRFFTEGNMPSDAPFANNTASFEGMSINALHYTDIGLGYTRDIGRMVVGGRARILLGKGNVHTERFNTTIKTDPDNAFALTAYNDYKLNASMGPFTYSFDENAEGPEMDDEDIINYVRNTKNLGFALDLGATYKVNEKLTVTGVVKDLGFITWKDNPTNYQGSGSFAFSGVNDLSFGDDSDFDTDALTDSLKEKFYPKETHEKYTSYLTAQNYLLANYQLAKNTKVGAGIYAEYFNGIRPAFTANINQRLGRIMNLQVSYSIQNRTYDNLGAGVMIKLLPFQFYVMSDNLTAAIKPAEARNVNFRMGMNFVFGKAKKVVKEGKPRDN